MKAKGKVNVIIICFVNFKSFSVSPANIEKLMLADFFIPSEEIQKI